MLDGFVLLSLGLTLNGADWAPAWLWLAVIASGLYHGANPGMGWPLSAGEVFMEDGKAEESRAAFLSVVADQFKKISERELGTSVHAVS